MVSILRSNTVGIFPTFTTCPSSSSSPPDDDIDFERSEKTELDTRIKSMSTSTASPSLDTTVATEDAADVGSVGSVGSPLPPPADTDDSNVPLLGEASSYPLLEDTSPLCCDPTNRMSPSVLTESTRSSTFPSPDPDKL